MFGLSEVTQGFQMGTILMGLFTSAFTSEDCLLFALMSPR